MHPQGGKKSRGQAKLPPACATGAGERRWAWRQGQLGPEAVVGPLGRRRPQATWEQGCLALCQASLRVGGTANTERAGHKLGASEVTACGKEVEPSQGRQAFIRGGKLLSGRGGKLLSGGRQAFIGGGKLLSASTTQGVHGGAGVRHHSPSISPSFPIHIAIIPIHIAIPLPHWGGVSPSNHPFHPEWDSPNIPIPSLHWGGGYG